MSGPDAELLLRLPFDRYQRYGLTARIITGLPNGHQPLRVLEVGAHSHGDLQRFLPAERLVYLDVHAPLAGAPGGRFVHGDATASPFAEQAFDAAVALDVLEHVPVERRGRFVGELLRASRRLVVLAAPFHAPEVVAEEIRLNGYFHDVHGRDFPWLAEHRLRGLPDLEETVRRVESEGWTTTVLGHGNVLLWARLMQAHLYVNSEPDLLPLRAEVDRLYNSELFACDWTPPVYRHFVVATASAEDARHLRGLLDTLAPIDDATAQRLQDHLERLYEAGQRQRARRHRSELARWADQAAARAHVEDEIRRQGETITGLQRALHEREESEAWALRRIDELTHRVEYEELLRARIFATKSWRVTAPLRAIEPTVRLLATLLRWRLHRMRLEPVNQLVIEDGGFRSTGEDPMFLLSSSRGELPRSWAFLSCDTESEGQWLDPKLYLDTGSGFSERETVKLPLRLKGRIEALVRLPNRVRAIRFDPMSAPGRFSIRGLTVREIGLLQVGFHLLVRHLRPALLQPRGLVRVARRALSILRTGGVKGIQRRLVALDHNVTDYQQWVAAYDTLSDGDRLLIRQHAESLPRKPLISVVMATYNTPERWLRLAIESVLRQLYPHWELCIADDGSDAPHVKGILAEYRDRDPRIKVTFRPQNGHMSAATNSALELARGEHVAFLDHDDELSEHALYMVAAELAEHPDAALIYSDEDKIDESGRRHGPYFKPDWNPDLFLAQNLVTHLCVCRTDLVRELGGLRLGYEGAQDWDLVMRLAERVPPECIRHIPHVLYHWRGVAGSAALAASEKTYVCEAQRKVLTSHFERVGQHVRIEPVAEVYWRVRYPLPDDSPLVSLIIPTRDRYDLLRRCVDSIYRRSTYPSFEIVLLDNQTTDPRALRYLEELGARPNVRVVRYDAPFNYSAINNFAVRHARGTVLALINNDIEVITRDWLEEMVSQALRPEIGAVGAMLYYPNDTIQHAGVILGLGGVAGHAYCYRPRGYSGQASRAFLAQNLSAVTAACMVLRREVFDEVGGLDETHLPIAYNDVDLCLRIRGKGYRVLWTPYAELYHHESASRGSDSAPTERARSRRELDYMQQPWGELLQNDPAYNPNLALDRESFALTFPPRAHKPWFCAADAA